MQQFWKRASRLLLLCAIVFGFAQSTPVQAAPLAFTVDPAAVFINEIHYDNAITDVGEFVEVAGPAGTDLSGWKLLLYNGSNGSVYDSDPLPSPIPDLGDGSGVVVVNYTGTFQNGAPDAIALVDSSGSVVQFLSYEGTFTAVGGAADGLTSTDIGVSEDGSQPVGQSLQLSGTGSVYADFAWNNPAAATPGAFNNEQTFVSTPTPDGCLDNNETLIHEIQGSGAASPLANTVVAVEGVVIGDYQGNTPLLRGFYLQEEDADADADTTTSEGIFVFSNLAVNVGDVVYVEGTVTEFGGPDLSLTELTNIVRLEVCATGASVTPTTINLPVENLAEWEQVEGMLVTFPQQLTVTEHFTLGRFGEVHLSVSGRLFQPTHLAAPGAPALEQQALNDRSRILLDDAQTAQNPDPVIYPSPYLSATNTLRTGYTVDNLTGILDQRFNEYRIQPLGMVSFNPTNPRPESPQDVGGTLKVASANVLNYFTTLDDGGSDCGPATNLQECRGANNSSEFERQRAKIIAGLAAINADVVGLLELENNETASLQDLIGGLNTLLGADTYAFIDTGFIGSDAIKVGILYKPATVAPVGDHVLLNSTVDPTFIDTLNRPAVAQTFEENATGERFTVAVNHLKSKGSDCNGVGDPDAGDGQGNCNGTRTAAAAALVNWLGTDPTGSSDPDFLIIGDLNSYAMEDPITTIKNAGYTDLLARFGSAGAYSYVFDGQTGYLDHALASESLLNQVTGATEWHVNADEPVVLDYNEEFKSAAQVDYFYTPAPYRFSDHDPLIVGLALRAATPEEVTEGTVDEGEKGTPTGLPRTGAPMPSIATIMAVVMAVVAVLAGGDLLRRRRD
ncbi:MAG: ExeM/NucH family extracellular endonuclease [Caldilineaceae bacterium]|nr:ExeM/NucH family extracellular endonuclease [Caldilineaceae bacterium]